MSRYGGKVITKEDLAEKVRAILTRKVQKLRDYEKEVSVKYC